MTDLIRNYRAPVVRSARRRRWIVFGAMALIVVLLVSIVGGGILDRPLAQASSSGSLASAGDSWPGVGGDLSARRRTTASPLLRAAAWTRELAAEVALPPVADRARLYVATADRRLIALSAADGRVAWTYEGSGPWSPPVLVGDLLYVGAASGGIVALEAATGAKRWEAAFEGTVFPSPVVAEGVLIVFAPGQLHGLDAVTGAKLWSVSVDEQWLQGTPVIVGGHLVVATNADLLIFDRMTGRETLRLGLGQISGVTASSDRIFSVSTDFVAAIDPESRTPWWAAVRGAWTWLFLAGVAPAPPRASIWATAARRGGAVFPPAFDGGAIAVTDEGGDVRAYRSDTGAQRWRVQVGRQAGPPTLTPAGLLLVGTDDLSLRRMDDGAEIARLPLPAASKRHVVVTTAATYVVDRSGLVTALR